DGEIVAEPHKHTVWTKVTMPENAQVMRDIKEKFTKSYTVNLGNYEVFDEHVHNPRALEVEVA
ncbi:MAG: formylmethanofuran dehydrogenase subunit A, partial [Methanobacteriota archaeon]